MRATGTTTCYRRTMMNKEEKDLIKISRDLARVIGTLGVILEELCDLMEKLP